MRRLFALIGFPYLVALAAAVYFGSTISLILCNICIITFGVLLFLRKKLDIRIYAIALLSAALALGSFSVYATNHVEPISALDGQKVTITGKLCELPYEQYNKHYYILEIESLKPAEEGTMDSLPVPDKIRISTQVPLRINLYDSITGNVRLYAPNGEDGFSSKSYYASKGITMLGFLYEYEPYTITPAEGKPLYYYALRMREAMVQAIKSSLPEREAGLLSAAVVGDMQNLDPEMKADFLASGTYHMLVVSGQHMTIISMFLLRLFHRVRLPRKLSLCLTAVAVLCFMAITGFSPSILRSGIMVLLMLGGMFVHRKTDAVNALGFAVFLICFLNPYAAADLGLLLSFASTLGMLVLSPKLTNLLKEKRISFTKHSKQKKLRHGIHNLIESLSVTVGVTICTLPIYILSGREISLIAPIANLIFLLPSTLMIQCGFLASVLNLLPAFQFLGKPLALLAGLLGKFFIWGTDILAKIPFAAVSPTHGFVSLWLIFSLCILAYLLLFYHKKQGYLIGGLLSVIVLFVGIFSYNLGKADLVRVAVLDVGDGISVVLSKNGKAAVLGCEGYRAEPIRSYLKTEGVKEITYLQLTSGENQEKKNAAELLSWYPVEHLLLEKSCFIDGMLEKELAKAEEVSYYQEDAEITLLGEVTVQLDGPYQECGIYFTVRDVSFLIVSESYVSDPTALEKQTADILITDGLPESAMGGAHMTTVLSMEEEDLQVLYNRAYLETETVNIYTTGGRGNLLMDVEQERKLKIRRGD